MRSVTRIITCLVSVLLHASGTPNPTVGVGADCRCLSFDQAEELGWDIAALREEYTAAVEAFPDEKAELAAAWSDLQYTLRDRLGEEGLTELEGHSIFTAFLFEPDGRIARVFYRGLEPDEETVLCEVVEKLAEEYRFPLTSSTRFSQCGTTHFKKN